MCDIIIHELFFFYARITVPRGEFELITNIDISYFGFSEVLLF